MESCTENWSWNQHQGKIQVLEWHYLESHSHSWWWKLKQSSSQWNNWNNRWISLVGFTLLLNLAFTSIIQIYSAYGGCTLSSVQRIWCWSTCSTCHFSPTCPALIPLRTLTFFSAPRSTEFLFFYMISIFVSLLSGPARSSVSDPSYRILIFWVVLTRLGNFFEQIFGCGGSCGGVSSSKRKAIIFVCFWGDISWPQRTGTEDWRWGCHWLPINWGICFCRPCFTSLMIFVHLVFSLLLLRLFWNIFQDILCVCVRQINLWLRSDSVKSKWFNVGIFFGYMFCFFFEWLWWFRICLLLLFWVKVWNLNWWFFYVFRLWNLCLILENTCRSRGCLNKD